MIDIKKRGEGGRERRTEEGGREKKEKERRKQNHLKFTLLSGLSMVLGNTI